MKTRPRRQGLPSRPAAEPERPLSPGRAFVVQFREEAPGAARRFGGRVEHMVSGHAARFESPEELLAFFIRILSAAQPDLPESQ